mmetsp:Transcript_438/g.462  ORF Transcript_438/g.462 Transcript_438/m.462 type:complete len:176 (-) Transcript_438:663-1190(-)|eukprot:CAMPEP_0197851786 /NCGR_PEP_ID=MMETSP1438-20131217/18868_1 /TAXON_ID=1461541 /ORGANISM="Pterosperma sp., Strain CCMP1384" /LENGTH=175 /DNA_ID=CAMNT_0043465517 /DNA_START=148 /DNA_END=675 /DNA_ORIENTATION=-
MSESTPAKAKATPAKGSAPGKGSTPAKGKGKAQAKNKNAAAEAERAKAEAERARSAEATTSELSGVKRKRGVFSRDLRNIMYGFGDSVNPLPETVNLMEELVTDYISDMTVKALELSTRRGRIAHQDLVFLIRKDTSKYERCLELLELNEELKEARKTFVIENNEYMKDGPDEEE